jgi:hypothetical protein
MQEIIVLLKLLLAQNYFDVGIVACWELKFVVVVSSTSMHHPTNKKWPRGARQIGEQATTMAQKTTTTTMTKTS